MPAKDRHGRPIIVAAEWFGRLPARPRKLKLGEQPTIKTGAAAVDETLSSNSDRRRDRS